VSRRAARIAAPVAIDGPSASGKSTVARRVAGGLGALYVDSGSVYRAVTRVALENGVDTSSNSALAAMMDRVNIDFAVKDGAVCVRIDGRHVGPEIRTEAVNRHVSPVAAQPEVRRRIVEWLRGMADLGPLVMEGRDIGTVVFPDTPFKFYLDASPEERARRRHAESGAGPTVDDVRSSLSRRDAIDSSRPVAPLQVARDAFVINTTSMSVDDVASAIVGRIRGKTGD